MKRQQGPHSIQKVVHQLAKWRGCLLSLLLLGVIFQSSGLLAAVATCMYLNKRNECAAYNSVLVLGYQPGQSTPPPWSGAMPQPAGSRVDPANSVHALLPILVAIQVKRARKADSSRHCCACDTAQCCQHYCCRQLGPAVAGTGWPQQHSSCSLS